MSDRKRAHGQSGGRTALHKNWRTWTVLIVMLTAISLYVLTLDDSVEPVEVTPVGSQP
jgi:hypothetical protein